MAAPLPEKKYLFISDKKNTFEISFSIDINDYSVDKNNLDIKF